MFLQAKATAKLKGFWDEKHFYHRKLWNNTCRFCKKQKEDQIVTAKALFSVAG